MFWQPVFFLLLLPLVIVEFILYFRTRKYSWVVYALAIFAFVISVTYVIDVFSLGRNAVILTLLASAGFLVLLARNFDAITRDTRPRRNLAWAVLIVLLVLAIVSVIFGKAAEATTPVASVKESDVLTFYNAQGTAVDGLGRPKPAPLGMSTPLLTRTITNNFVLPVPVVSKTYQACLITSNGPVDMYVADSGLYEPYPEVMPGSSKQLVYRFSQVSVPEDTVASEIRVFEQYGLFGGLSPCQITQAEPLHVIPVV
jgi:hypothetical protein